MSYEQQYLDLCKKILEEGEYTEDRTGTGTYSIFGVTMKHDLSEGFPLLTTKKVNFGLVAGELLFFLNGSTDLPTLRKYQNKPEGAHTIWSDDYEKYWDMKESWLGKDKDLLCERERQEGGRLYGKQWRSFNAIGADGYPIKHDQVVTLINNIIDVKNGNPYHARRLIVSAWNAFDHTVGEKKVSALSTCHDSFQCIVRSGKLNLHFRNRSQDTFLGAPYNIGSYSLLCHILAQLTGLEVGEVFYCGVDQHIYSNHTEQVKEQLSRTPRKMPKLILPEFETLEELLELTGKDFVLEEYNPHPFIKAPQAS
jgi:thymidylate synthase